MEQNKTLKIVGWVVLGLVLGWLLWGGRGMNGGFFRSGMMGGYGPDKHMMSDGEMMMNGIMDMDDMMSAMTRELKSKSGDAFDQAFIDEMITHHEGAVEMAELVLANSKRPELIKLANDIISAQTNEIQMMKGWRNDWFQ